MDLGLAGTRAVITGASRGVGRAIAARLLLEGAQVSICARKPQPLEATMAELSELGTITGQAVDVADHAALADWVNHVITEWDGVDLVISNASALGGVQRSADGWHKQFDVDVLSAVTAFDTALPALQASDRAAFVQIATITAVEYHGFPGGCHSYGALKAALVNWVKQLAIEYAPDGIRANAVSPGPIFIEGGSWDRIQQRLPAYYEENLARQPSGRFGTADEVANVVAFLASPRASWVTGENVVIDGGFTDRFGF